MTEKVQKTPETPSASEGLISFFIVLIMTILFFAFVCLVVFISKDGEVPSIAWGPWERVDDLAINLTTLETHRRTSIHPVGYLCQVTAMRKSVNEPWRLYFGGGGPIDPPHLLRAMEKSCIASVQKD